MRVNADLMRRRRRELGMSERDLAAAAGVSKMFVRYLECGGGDDQVTVEMLRRMGRALGVSAGQLLEEEGIERSGHDVAAVGAMLTELIEPTPPAVLASTLGWGLERTEAALAGLEATAPGVGLALQRIHGMVSLRRSATDLDAERLRRGHATGISRRGLSANAARMLYLVLTDTLGDKRRPTITEQQALIQLRNGGLLVESAPETHLARQTLAVSADVEWSLRAD